MFEVGWLKVARVHALANFYSRVGAQPVINLVMTNIKSDNVSSAVLEQTVGESAGGRANVQAFKSIYIDCKFTQSGFEFEAAASYVAGGWIVSAFDTHVCVWRDRI